MIRRARARDAGPLGEALAESLEDLRPWFRWAEPLARWGSVGDLGQRAVLAENGHALGCDPTYYLWDRRSPERLIGEVALKTEGWPFGVLTYTVWVRRSAAGTGLATEGSAALLEAAFATAGADLVEAECAYANFRSRRLLLRLGFEPWGATQSHQRYLLDPKHA